MNDIVIDVENLGKKYTIATAKDKGRTFREALTDKVLTPLQRIRKAFAHDTSGFGAEPEPPDFNFNKYRVRRILPARMNVARPCVTLHNFGNGFLLLL